MRLVSAVFAAMALTSCATAVYDSLDRRGVDSAEILRDRIIAVRDDAAVAKMNLEAARDALAAVNGLDGPALASQLDRVKAASADASVAAQDYRLSLDSARAAGNRYLDAKNAELKLLDDAALSAARTEMNSALKAQGAFFSAATGASLRLSPALTLYSNEVATMRAHPTSGVFAESRLKDREAVASSMAEAIRSLSDVADAAGGAITATK